MERIKNIIISTSFIIVLLLILLINLFSENQTISKTERRKLAEFPKVNFENLLKGKVAKEFDEYVVDQFWERDFFRKIKYFWSINIFKQKDDNKYFEKDGAIYKIEYPLKENNVEKTANKILEIYDKYLDGMKVYYAIIPDKNYYLNSDDYLVMDYEKMKKIVNGKLSKLNYIDIWNELELKDFYSTDLHWKQECLGNVVNKIEVEMGISVTSNEMYEKENVGKFYGIYYGQILTDVDADDMYILTNNNIKACSTYNYETNKTGSVYDKKETIDKYDIYLSGATPLITIDNSNAKNEKELILFRDSFGSSIAPLLIENYKKITVIDLRYMSSDLLSRYVEFDNQDVLFLYSSLVLNQNILK